MPDVKFTVIDSAVEAQFCDAIAQQIRDALEGKPHKHDTHLQQYAQLPAALYDLGLRTPDNRVHLTLLQPHKAVHMHEHPWPGFVFFPADHPSPFMTTVPPLRIETTAGRLVLVPTGLSHWVKRNETPFDRLAIASEITDTSAFAYLERED